MAPPAPDPGGGDVYVSTEQGYGAGRLYAVAAAGGRLRRAESPASAPAAGPDAVYVATRDGRHGNGELRAYGRGRLAAVPGTSLQTLADLPGSPVGGAPAVGRVGAGGGRVYVSACAVVGEGATRCAVAAHRAGDGALLCPHTCTVWAPALLWEAAVGDVRPPHPGAAGQVSSPVAAPSPQSGDELVLVSSNASGGIVVAFDGATGRLAWNFSVGDP
eukprot:gene864-38778_t